MRRFSVTLARWSSALMLVRRILPPTCSSSWRTPACRRCQRARLPQLLSFPSPCQLILPFRSRKDTCFASCVDMQPMDGDEPTPTRAPRCATWGPPELGPPPQLHPRRLHSLRHLIQPASPGSSPGRRPALPASGSCNSECKRRRSCLILATVVNSDLRPVLKRACLPIIDARTIRRRSCHADGTALERS